MRKVFIIVQLTILSSFVSPIFSQERGFVKRYSIEEGLSQSQVHTMKQDKGGYLWFGTEGGGLVRFDGITFTSYTNNAGLADNIVYTLDIDTEGKLWAGTSKGVSVFFNNRFLPLPPFLKPISEQAIRFLLVTKSKEIIFCTDIGAFIYDGNVLVEIPQTKGINVLGAYEDKRGNLWLGTRDKGIVVKSADGSFKNMSITDGLSSNTVYCFKDGQDGKFYIGTENGVNVIENNTFSKFPLPAPALAKQIVRFINYDREGFLWIGTFGCGVFKCSKDKITVYGKNDIGIESASAFLQDTEGNIWLGTDGSGAAKIGKQIFTSINYPGAQSDNYVLSVLQDSRGRSWFGIQAGLLLYENNNFTLFNGKNGLRNEKIWSVVEDNDKNIWVSTYGSGVFKYNGKGFVNYNEKNGLSGNNIRRMYVDSKHRLWIGTTNGLSLLKPERERTPEKMFELYTKENSGLAGDRVLSFFEDTKQNLWVGSAEGLSVYSIHSDTVKFKTFYKKDGLASTGILVTAEDKQGYIWLASFGGLNRIDPVTGKIISITDKDGLISNTIFVIAFTNDNHLMVGTNNGIDKLDVTEFNRSGKIYLKHYGAAEGFLGIECNTGSIMKDSVGKIWIGSMNGVYIYEPKQDKPNDMEPRTHISNVRLFFKNFNINQYATGDTSSLLPVNITLPYDKNHLTFDFVGLSYTIPGYVKYRYMIEGYDRDWSIPVSERFATYSNLPPGNYVFKVMSCNNDGVWNKEPVSFRFSITPPFWKTWWFKTVCIVAGILLVAGFVNIRLRRLKQIQKMLSEQVQLKTKELREEKETVEYQNKLIEKKNQNITSSIHYARRIQESILPFKQKLNEFLPQSFILYKPKDIVSGDFYWFTKLKDSVMLAAVDCTGHGVPGAFMSLVGNNLLNDIVNSQKITDTKVILEKLHEGVVKMLKKDELESGTVDGMDIILCLIHSGTNSMEFASTGRPLMLVRGGEIQKYKIGKQPVGLVTQKEPVFEKQELELKPGDTFYISTDGYCDQFGGKDEDKFMESNFEKLLLSIRDQPMSEQEFILKKTIDEWRGSVPQVDDILVIGVRVG